MIEVEHSTDNKRWKKIPISAKSHIAKEISKAPTYFDGIANHYRRIPQQGD
jgi:hypothetical protein